jgi:hypothetical protein
VYNESLFIFRAGLLFRMIALRLRGTELLPAAFHRYRGNGLQPVEAAECFERSNKRLTGAVIGRSSISREAGYQQEGKA